MDSHYSDPAWNLCAGTWNFYFNLNISHLQHAPREKQEFALDVFPRNPQAIVAGWNSIMKLGIRLLEHPHGAGKRTINHSPVLTMFVGGMVTIPSHGWFLLFHTSQKISHDLQLRRSAVTEVWSWSSPVAFPWSRWRRCPPSWNKSPPARRQVHDSATDWGTWDDLGPGRGYHGNNLHQLGDGAPQELCLIEAFVTGTAPSVSMNHVYNTNRV